LKEAFKVIWKVSDSASWTGGVDYIRAESLDEAKEIYSERHKWNHADTFQPVEDKEKIFAVYFSDEPGSPAFFRGALTKVKAAAHLYIRQWQLDAVIDRIIEI